jgi:putative PIN family toxin of toxin-antitoxin system
MDRIVLDTNVFVSALLKADTAPRSVLRLALNQEIRLVFGNALFAEYEALLARDELFARSPLTRVEREDLFGAVLSTAEWVGVHFLWRPNLPDEADNHVLELAIASGADALVTSNARDYERSELRFPTLRILAPADYLTWREER